MEVTFFFTFAGFLLALLSLTNISPIFNEIFNELSAILDTSDNLLEAGGIALLLLTGSFVGFVFGLIVRPVYCWMIAVFWTPFLYPIYLIFIKCINKIRSKKNAKTFAKYKALINEEISKNKKKTDDLCDYYIRRDDEYEALFFEKAEEKSKKFDKSELVDNVVNYMFSVFVDNIEKCTRASYLETVKYQMVYWVYRNKIYIFSCDHNSEKDDKSLSSLMFNVYEHRWNDLDNALAQTALAKTITDKLHITIKDNIKADISGGKYVLACNVAFFSAEEWNADKSGNEEDYIDIPVQGSITYVADNKNYKPTQSW